ncbi:MAG: universal stress protein [Acidimicrobiales bacterium]
MVEASERSEAADNLVEPTGKFRVYIGAVAGVGKTWAMLDEGWRRYKRGADVVIGFVETHGRQLTAQQIRDLPIVPRKSVEYRGTRFEEMDLEAVLARKAGVTLIDELAHTNVPGSGPHAKRWEDVLEILEAGISVISTVNIQHLESVADAVQQITGVAVRERVPDWVVRKADQVELIDSSPEQLRRRMLHGHIYPPEKIPQALNSFFRSENISALRELALRFVADETEEDLLAYLVARHPDIVWDTAERIMVAVTGSAGADRVLRRAARIAARVHADLQVVHVVADDSSWSASKEALASVKHLAEDLGASWHDIVADDPAQALVQFAKDHQITQIALGASRRSPWEPIMSGVSLVQRVLRFARQAGVDVHVIARYGAEAPPRAASAPEEGERAARAGVTAREIPAAR